MTEPTVPEVIKVETTRQVIVLVFGIVTIVLMRKFSDPDTIKLFKMRSALTIKRWADIQADRFTRLAGHMATIYNGEKL